MRRAANTVNAILMKSSAQNLKRAELLSSVGAGVLGGGLALLVGAKIAPYALLVVIVGLVMHGGGMYEKHRLERASSTRTIWWAEALYWACWLGLVGLAAYILRA